jgi:hypothetical protein
MCFRKQTHEKTPVAAVSGIDIVRATSTRQFAGFVTRMRFCYGRAKQDC